MTNDKPFPEEPDSKSRNPGSSRPDVNAMESMMLQLVDTLPAYLWIGDAQGNITWLNDMWYRSTGLNEEQSLGTGWAQVLHPDDQQRCLKIWLEALESGSIYEVEVRYRMADGTYRWVLARAEPRWDENGKITNWFGTSIDIEDKKRAEEELRQARSRLEHKVQDRATELANTLDRLNESQAQFRLAVDHYPATFVIYDQDRRIEFINPYGAAIAGKPEKELIGKRDEEVFPPEISSTYLPLLQSAIDGGQARTDEVVMPMKSGFRTFIVSFLPVLDNAGKVKQILGITHDISARKQAEKQREILERAVETTTEAISIIAPDGVIQYVNEAFERMFGYETGELIGKPIEIVNGGPAPEKTREDIMSPMGESGRWSGEVYNRRKDGTTFYTEASVTAIKDDDGKTAYVIGAQRDITERKQADQQREILERAVETTTEAISITARDGSIQYVNKALENMFGYGHRELIGKSIEILNAGPTPEKTQEGILSSIGSGLWTGEIHNRRKDGSAFFTEASLAAIKDNDGEIAYIVGARRDITERKQAEQALRDSEARFRTLAEVAPVGICFSDKDGKCQYVNQQWCDLGGIQCAEAMELGWQNVIHEDDLEMTRSYWQEMVRTGGSTSFEYRYVQPDGTVKWIYTTARAVTESGRHVRGFIGVSVDITERKAAEAEREQLLDQVVKEQQAYAELAAVLQAERDIMKTIMENTRTQLAYLDYDFNFIGVNAAYAAGSGHTVRELIGRNHFDLFPNEENQAIFERVRSTGEPVEFRKKPFEYTGQPERGITYWDWSLVPVKDAKGKSRGFVFSLLNVTDEVRADQELAKIHADAELDRRRLRAMLDVLPIGVFIADENGKLVEINPAARETWGTNVPVAESSERYIEFKAWKPDTGEPIDFSKWGLGDTLKTGKTYNRDEIEIETFDGTRKTILNYAVPIRDTAGNIRGGVAVNVDISERKRAQKALRESEERYTLAQRLAHIGSWDWDIVNDELRWSEQVAPILGLDPELRIVDLKTFTDTIHPEDRPRIEAAIDACLKKGKHYTEEHRIIWPDGTVRWVEEMGDVIHDERGRPVRMVGMIYDITNRKLILEAKARLAAIVESSDDAIIGKTLDGIITSWNTGAERMYGYRAHEAVGQSILMIIPPERAEEETVILNRVRRGGRVEQMDTIRTRRGGNRLYVSVSVSPVKDERGNVVAISTIARDITEQKRAEWALRESEERFRIALKHSRISVGNVDGQGRFTWAHNPPAGLPLGKLLGRRMEELAPCEGAREMTEAKIKVFESGVGSRGEFALELADGTHYFDLTAEPLRDAKGDVIGVTSASMDITERKQTEQEIKKMNEMLTVHAVELAEANKELEAFSYSVSHDLRAPLRSIDGFSLALLEDYGETLDGTAKDYLRRVRAASQNMAQLIDDLLKLSRVSRAEIRHETVDMSEIAKRFAESLKESDPERSVEFLIEDGLTAYGDQHLLKIVIENFLRNSWKFTAKHPAAKIEFGRTEQYGEPLFYIRDDGAGFDMNYADKLFLVFQRLHSTSEFAGTGVGLPLIKRIIERHGGRVWGEGEVEKGATFYFTL